MLKELLQIIVAFTVLLRSFRWGVVTVPEIFGMKEVNSQKRKIGISHTNGNIKNEH